MLPERAPRGRRKLIPPRLRELLLAKLGVSAATLIRRAQAYASEYGPMSMDDAKYILAHEAGIKLRQFLSSEETDRIQRIRSSVGSPNKRVSTTTTTPPQPATTSLTEVRRGPGAAFDERQVHAAIVKQCRKLFVGGHYADCIRRAFQSVNNRVKKLVPGTRVDGYKLMAEAFKPESPQLMVSGLNSPSERDEQQGLHHLFMGAMLALRNPHTHEDHWRWDKDASRTLEALGFASLLHHYLDLCEEHRRQATA